MVGCDSRPSKTNFGDSGFMGCNHLITFLRPGISWPSVAATPAGAEMGVCGQLGIRRPAFTIGAGPGRLLPITHNALLLPLFFYQFGNLQVTLILQSDGMELA